MHHNHQYQIPGVPRVIRKATKGNTRDSATPAHLPAAKAVGFFLCLRDQNRFFRGLADGRGETCEEAQEEDSGLALTQRQSGGFLFHHRRRGCAFRGQARQSTSIHRVGVHLWFSRAWTGRFCDLPVCTGSSLGWAGQGHRIVT